jgi:hypothetical protein
MAALYPSSLTQDMQLLRSLNDELGQLQALIAGAPCRRPRWSG